MKSNNVLVCMVLTGLMIACNGKTELSKVTNNLTETVWLEDYGVGGEYQLFTGETEPYIYFNVIEFDKEGKLVIGDSYHEYPPRRNDVPPGPYEYDVSKNNELIIYLYPKADVMAVKEKEPSTWLQSKDSFIITGQLNDDVLTFPSKMRKKEGQRAFKKMPREEVDKIFAGVQAEYAIKEQEYSEKMAKYRSKFK